MSKAEEQKPIVSQSKAGLGIALDSDGNVFHTKGSLFVLEHKTLNLRALQPKVQTRHNTISGTSYEGPAIERTVCL